jgi:glutathione synthase/RimK-type ligase-like ATP-grasp enzyme
MARHIVIVQKPDDQQWAESAGIAVTAREYVVKADLYGSSRARVVNLSGDYGYMDMGYYCSLLAEARKQKVVPTVETILDLSRKTLYGLLLPELNGVLRQEIEKLPQLPRGAFTLVICFGQPMEAHFKTLARRVFERFRCPLMKVSVDPDDNWQIRALDAIAPSDLSRTEFEFFLAALEDYTRSSWPKPKARSAAKYSLAVLHNPREAMPPSDPQALRKFISVGASLGVEVDLIERKDFSRLAEYDALFIRETTGIDNHTFRFAKKAIHEGMPVIDDPVSILRCTNKVYLAELLQANKLPAPRTLIVDRGNLQRVEEELGYPVVLKIPDGSFSRGVVRAEDRPELEAHARKLFKRSDLILAQEFMYTEFDWRVGVLNGQPLYVSQYRMSRKHWQIVNHRADGKVVEGGFATLAVMDAPEAVIDTALNAARLIGDGLYGVDLKQNDKGVFVIEINDNPSIERHVEDLVLKDDLYRAILQDFVRRIEAR